MKYDNDPIKIGIFRHFQPGIVLSVAFHLQPSMRGSKMQSTNTTTGLGINLTQFVEKIPVAVAILDHELRYLMVSKKWFTDFQIKTEDLRGKSHYQQFPKMTKKCREIHARCLEGVTERNEGEAFETDDGRVTWLRWEIQPWYDANRVGGIIIYSEDISPRKRIEESLKYTHQLLLEQQKRNHLILQHASATVWAIDLHGNFIFYEGDSAVKLGIDSKDRIGKNVFELMQHDTSFLKNVKLNLSNIKVKIFFLTK